MLCLNKNLLNLPVEILDIIIINVSKTAFKPTGFYKRYSNLSAINLTCKHLYEISINYLLRSLGLKPFIFIGQRLSLPPISQILYTYTPYVFYILNTCDRRFLNKLEVTSKEHIEFIKNNRIPRDFIRLTFNKTGMEILIKYHEALAFSDGILKEALIYLCKTEKGQKIALENFDYITNVATENSLNTFISLYIGNLGRDFTLSKFQLILQADFFYEHIDIVIEEICKYDYGKVFIQKHFDLIITFDDEKIHSIGMLLKYNPNIREIFTKNFYKFNLTNTLGIEEFESIILNYFYTNYPNLSLGLHFPENGSLLDSDEENSDIDEED